VNEQECLSRMKAPGDKRPGKFRDGVIQVWVTRACDKSCWGCTQGSNLAGKPGFITPEQYEQALISLKGYWGVVGMFGGNPTMHPQFPELCKILRKYVPFEQRGLWSNHPRGHGKVMAQTFNPRYSNLNVHMDQAAYNEFKRDWPTSNPFGLQSDSRHSPPFVAMKDVIADEGKRWELISNCDINQHWSAMIGVFRGELRAWFCEIAGAQAMLHQDEPDYPDTGLDPTHYYLPSHISCKEANNPNLYVRWWQLPMSSFSDQVRKHCHECGVPLRGFGQLSQSERPEQASRTHEAVYRSKRRRPLELVEESWQLRGHVPRVIDYVKNGGMKQSCEQS